ncbi:hypothetical protein [Mesorhizobium wenxiniae]|uniref:Uncharacterized protein n=1 Tax=Mesorhizobium wenxiniae TaxID=2014805 RepID=A0A271K6L4_9HYPH|nr:hypothetical protein [Mesorhizobium wenxiniae]PAP91402.1 hypothetical protein CIT31_32525 [Mesorhizobium wenxiniae]
MIYQPHLAPLYAIRTWITHRDGIPRHFKGYEVDGNDPDNHLSVDEAMSRVKGWPTVHSGAGFVFSADHPFIGIDVDLYKLTPDHPNYARVTDIVERCKRTTYWQYSPSGKGFHFIFKVRDKPFTKVQGLLGCIEIFATVGYFRMTGNAPDPRPIADLEWPDEWVANATPVSTVYTFQSDLSGLEEIKARVARKYAASRYEAERDIFTPEAGQALYRRCGSRHAADMAFAQAVAVITYDVDIFMALHRMTGLAAIEFKGGGDPKKAEYKNQHAERYVAKAFGKAVGAVQKMRAGYAVDTGMVIPKLTRAEVNAEKARALEEADKALRAFDATLVKPRHP